MVIFFGIRSAITVEYEETCHRLGIRIEAAVSLQPGPRILDRSKIVDLADFKVPDDGAGFYACAFFPATRKAHFARAQALGLSPADALIDPYSVLARSIRVGGGSFINAGTIIGAVTMIGEAVLINRGVTIGHHCIIGDFSSIGPGATLASNIH